MGSWIRRFPDVLHRKNMRRSGAAVTPFGAIACVLGSGYTRFAVKKSEETHEPI